MSKEIVSTQGSGIAPRLSDVVSVPRYDTPQIDFNGAPLETDLEIKEGDSSFSKNREKSSVVNPYVAEGQLKPLPFWSKALKEKFNELSPDVKKAWLESFAITEKSFNKMAKDLKMAYKETEKVMKVVEPYLDNILKSGFDLDTYFKGLLKSDALASKNPIEYILRLMGIHKVSFKDLEKGLPSTIEALKIEEQIDPLAQQVESLKEQLQGSQSPVNSGDESVETLAQKIEDFYSQTDDSGSLLYPDATKYYDEIIELLREGSVTSLHDAYRVAKETASKVSLPSSNMKSSNAGGSLEFNEKSYENSGSSALDNKKLLRHLAKQLEASYN
jgi:hypothetical protein